MTLSDVSIPNVGAGCTRNASPTVIDPPAAYVKQAHPRFEMGEKKRGVLSAVRLAWLLTTEV